MTDAADSIDLDDTEAIHGLSRTEFVALSSMISATIAISIDTILPAFDEIEEALEIEAGSASLAITVFLAAMGIGMLVWGPLADRYGRKPIIQLSLALFIAGALVSTFATSFTVFLVGRVIWGVAAAGPRVIGLAIVRDCYSGDLMARIMSLTAAVFLIVPILAPGVGEVVLLFGSWRLTPAVAVVLALVVVVWLFRLPETLDPNNVVPLSARPLLAAVRTVVTNRVTAAFTLATTFGYAAFFPWLGSSPQIINELYDRPGQFALLFGLNAGLMALGIVTTERLVKRWATLPVVLTATAILIGFSIAYIGLSLASDGRPAFWTWFAFACVLTMLNAATTPLMQTLAMEPMGAVAGMASSVTGAIIFIASALLASIVDRAIVDTVTPFGVGFLVFTILALAAMLGSGLRSRATT